MTNRTSGKDAERAPSIWKRRSGAWLRAASNTGLASTEAATLTKATYLVEPADVLRDWFSEQRFRVRRRPGHDATSALDG